jgi:hypothetical protein
MNMHNKEDIKELYNIYLELVSIGAKLFTIMERHPEVKTVKDHLFKSVQALSDIAHGLIHDATELKEEDNES